MTNVNNKQVFVERINSEAKVTSDSLGMGCR